MNFISVLLIALVTFIAAIDQFSFLESLYQPIVLGPIIGLILGNPTLGLVVGGTYQLVQIGSMPVGGAQPPNVVIGGIMATVFAVTTSTSGVVSTDGLNAGTAVGLAIPFAALGQLFVTLLFSLMSPIMKIADKHAENANSKGIVNLNYMAMGILGLAFAVVAVLGCIGGKVLGEQLADLFDKYNYLPVLFQTFGGMLRFVGFAILMRIMLSKDLWVFYFAGFAGATILGQLPALSESTLLILAMIGTAIAVFDYQINTKFKSTNVARTVGGDEDGI